MMAGRKGEEEMKKIGSSVFVAACMALCLLPFAGMAVAPTNTTTENRRLVSFPEMKKEGRWNQEWLGEAGAYFEDHFAFRPYIVTAESEKMGRVLGESAMDTVIDGKDGWLYYSSTRDDYLGADTLSERGAYNALHNLSLLKRYVEGNGAKFLFTAAPNKNSLYGEHMPYYAGKKVSDIKNIELIEPGLKKEKILYADLFTVFKDQKETLYLKRDSHWNQKGAVLAYHTMLDALGKEHDTYETVPAVRTKTEYGDLNRMVYPKSAVPEWNLTYEKEYTYQYVSDFESVEDAWVETGNEKGQGSLLMFRDSFGNTLLPLMADVYKKAYFSKSVPYPVEEYMTEYHPDTVIAEKVERNLDEFAKEPPVMTGLPVKLEEQPEVKETKTTFSAGESEYDMSYLKLGGVLDPEYVKKDTNVFMSVACAGQEQSYEAFTVSDETTDNGYLLYLSRELISGDSLEVSVITETEGNLTVVKQESFPVPSGE